MATTKKTRKKTSKKKTSKKKASRKTSLSVTDIHKELAKSFMVEIMDEKAPDLTPYYIPFRHRALQAITGGVPGGTWTEIVGDSQSGKSFLLYELICSVLNMGGFAMLHDIENAYQARYGKKVGIEGSKQFIRSKEKQLEKIFQSSRMFVDKIRKVDKDCPILLGMDSYAPAGFAGSIKELQKTDAKEVKGYLQAKKNAIMSQLMGEFTSYINDNKVAFVLLNQGRKKMGVMFGDDKTSNAENVIQFYVTLRIWGYKGAKIRKIVNPKSKKKKVIGLRSDWETIKNRNIPPYKKCSTNIIYNKGVNSLSGFLDLLVDQGLATKIPRKPKLVNFQGEELTAKEIVKDHWDDVVTMIRDEGDE